MGIELTNGKLEKMLAQAMADRDERKESDETRESFYTGMLFLQKAVLDRLNGRQNPRIPQDVVLDAFKEAWQKNRKYLMLAYDKKASENGIGKIEAEGTGMEMLMVKVLRAFNSRLMYKRYRNLESEVLKSTNWPF